MYLGTGDLIAIIIGLIAALATIGVAVKVNAELTKENKRLRYRVRDLNKQVEIHG